MALPPSVKQQHRIERFWKKVKKTDTCWLWTGGTSGGPAKYGIFTSHRKRYRAHRYSFELAHGPIPHGLFVCHRCDVTLCVRPDHLFLGTQQDNIDDAVKKGRLIHGEQTITCKLSERDVLEIIRRYQPGVVTHRQLASEYGVGRIQILRIVKGQRWKHLNAAIHVGDQRKASNQVKINSKRLVAFKGVTRTMKQWADDLGIVPASLGYRLKHWPKPKALTCPKQSA